MCNFFSKIIRRLIDMDILGGRFINLTKSGISYDFETKRLFQNVNSNKVYIARCSHGVPNVKRVDMVNWLNEEVYFSKYIPNNNDVYLDIGCGYGHELIYVAEDNSNVNVYGIEANPEVYNYCEANTSRFDNIKNFNLMIGEKKSYKIPFTSDYAGKGTHDSGSVLCKGMTLEDFMNKENLEIINFMKLNIEGGEKEIIANLPHERIQRMVISCHDFRYERGEDIFYKTFDDVKSNLCRYGYNVEVINPKFIPSKEWGLSLKYWIYASK